MPKPDIVAAVKRMPYAEASRALLRDSVLDAMRDLLVTRDWSAITLSDVARAAGISRQTIYNEFGSRQGLAQGYALRLADRLVDTIHEALDAHVGNIYESFLDAFRRFFADAAADPLVTSLRTGVAKPDLLQLITTDSAVIITRASARLASALTHTWCPPPTRTPGAGPRHRAAGAELRVDAARGRPRRGRRSGPVDDAVRRAARRRQRRVSVPWPRRGADPRLQWRKNIPKLITQ